MKKFKLFMMLGIALVSITFLKTGVYAKNGDIIGKVYSTDIIAKIDGLNAPSYNINGKTAIIIEELSDKNSSLSYAIKAKYDDNERRLDVTMSSSSGFWGEQYNEIKRGSVGKILGDVYETDIKVYFNGYEIDGINIGGKTAVVIEDLGLIGGINEEFGYSKYRCKAKWNEDERIIALDFIDEKSSFSVYDYANFLKYRINDNIISAEFDRMAECVSEIIEYNISDEFKKEANVLKPLYFDDGKEKTEIGFMYVENDTVDGSFLNKVYITKPELMKTITENIHDEKTPTADEAFEFLDDKINYKTLDVLETEDFYVACVELLKVDKNISDISFVLIKKTGGFGKIYSGSTYYKERKMEKTGENTIKIFEGPTLDPHGKPVMISCEFNLNNYFVK
ncbi:MAG: hypothetical protein E7404_03080 [Ruminococcaceae bacterium]|nr:hypothetical protein [Oscillospiraceae bacterium]